VIHKCDVTTRYLKLDSLNHGFTVMFKSKFVNDRKSSFWKLKNDAYDRAYFPSATNVIFQMCLLRSKYECSNISN
jgi:hypothetical protein